ncbi:MAG: hypothetical protein Kow0074_24010 [Candidatus Zixiibacteriota bacterium]
MPEPVIPITPWLQHLKDHVPVAREGSDPEGVHQLRVATRRLDAWLVLAQMNILRDDLRWLRRRASAVRDLDVLLLEIKPPAPLSDWLQGLHDTARRELLVALEHPRYYGLITALEGLPPMAGSSARLVLPTVVRQVLRRGKAVENAHQDLQKLHRLRRGARRLRYCLEWLGMNTKPLKAVQRVLGEANDIAMTLRYLNQSPHRDSLSDYRINLENQLVKLAARSAEVWAASRASFEGLA